MDNYTIELIKQVGAVGFIAILVIKQNGKLYDRLMKITENNFHKLFDRIDDVFHKQEGSLLSYDQVEDMFNDIAEQHKLKKFEYLTEKWEEFQNGSIEVSVLKEDIERKFKTITRPEVEKFNRIKSKAFNKDLGTKFDKIIVWEPYIDRTVDLFVTCTSLTDLKNKFFDLTEENLSIIKTKLKI